MNLIELVSRVFFMVVNRMEEQGIRVYKKDEKDGQYKPILIGDFAMLVRRELDTLRAYEDARNEFDRDRR